MRRHTLRNPEVIMVLLLTERDVKSLLTMEMALEAVEEAFRGLADGSVRGAAASVPSPVLH